MKTCLVLQINRDGMTSVMALEGHVVYTKPLSNPYQMSNSSRATPSKSATPISDCQIMTIFVANISLLWS